MNQQTRSRDWTRESAYSGRPPLTRREVEKSAVIPPSPADRALAPAQMPVVPRSIRILRVVGSVLLSFGIVAALVASGWALAIGSDRAGLLAWLPFGLVLLAVGAAWLARRFGL